MKNNPNHGNRLRPPAEAYEVKKKRSRERYAASQLKNDPYWLHNRILRDLSNLYGLNVEIPIEHFLNRGFNIDEYKAEYRDNGLTIHCYDTYGFIISNKKMGIICKIKP
jgi:hypothetical protein